MRLRQSALSASGGAANGAAALEPPGRAPGRGRRAAALAEAVPVFVLLLLTGLLYGGALRLWWLDDDFFNLRFVRAWAPGDYCLDPAVWQRLPFRMLTPLLFVSYDADLALFGAQPRGFYVHQLAALALAAVALYLLLRAWLDRRWALLGGAMLLAGAPMANLATSVMARHYLECLALLFLAGAAWVVAVRSRDARASWSWSVVSALLWLAAALAKEIAVPMVLLPLLLPEGSPALRLRRLVPHALALGLYLGYRRFLMGALVGGYGWAVEGGDWPRLAAQLPGKVGRELLGSPSVAAWISLALLLGGIAAGLRGRRGLLLLALGALMALLPLLPVATEVKPRYGALPWAVVVVAFVGAASRLRRGAWLAAAAAAAVLLANRGTWEDQLQRARRASAENRALLRLHRGDVLRHPAAPPASLDELRRYAAETLGRRVEAAWLFDDLYLCLHGGSIRRLWEYDPAAGDVVEETARLGSLRQASCRDPRPEVPLSARFRVDDGVLWWSLGPYTEGRWTFVLRDGASSFAVPRRGGFHLEGLSALPLYLRFDDPNGWTTYSGLLRVDLTRPGRYAWTRPAR